MSKALYPQETHKDPNAKFALVMVKKISRCGAQKGELRVVGRQSRIHPNTWVNKKCKKCSKYGWTGQMLWSKNRVLNCNRVCTRIVLEQASRLYLSFRLGVQSQKQWTDFFIHPFGGLVGGGQQMTLQTATEEFNELWQWCGIYLSLMSLPASCESFSPATSSSPFRTIRITWLAQMDTYIDLVFCCRQIKLHPPPPVRWNR